MKFNFSLVLIFFISVILSCKPASHEKKVEAITIEVDINKPLVKIQSTMYGIFFEDINAAADGGLYAELIKNRSFEFEYPWMGWKHLPVADTRFNTVNELTIINNTQNSKNNLRFIRVEKRDSSRDFGIQNEGFDGIGIHEDAKYDFSFWAKNNSGNIKARAELVDTSGNVVGSVEIIPTAAIWTKWEGVLTGKATIQHAKINIYFEGKGQLDLDHISLFPQDTWKGRKGGLRKDLVQLLADMKPGFVRFPGGCIVEGRTLDERYQWKKSVDSLEERKVMINRWNMEFAHRPAPDYFQSFGLGFYEYFLLAEDIGAEPVPILSCGLACQFNSSELVPLNEIDMYIQDALDLIEFANGATNTTWGKRRAKMGHTEPFNLKFIGVGNEQWGQEYFERYALFAKAIKAKYPGINIISGTGPFAEGELFESAEKELAILKPEIVDEHYYKKPKWFLENATRYDHYDRNRYKIFGGEYAAQSVSTGSPLNKNTWECALSEAAFMTGLERNADVVYMSSYAPLFAHVNRWQWTPDLIWFDNLTSFGTINYHVQKLYATNKGTNTLSIKRNGENMTGQDGLYGSASLDSTNGDIIIKLVNVLPEVKHVTINLNGMKGKAEAKVISLQNKDVHVFNTIQQPAIVKPEEESISVNSGIIDLNIEASGFKVMRIPKG